MAHALALNEGIEKVAEVARRLYPEAYLGGLETLRVEWLPKGTKFIINEYDGSESIQRLDETDWLVA